MLKQRHLCNEGIEVGLDEAGRGTLVGRVYTGAVVWDPEMSSSLIKDSKKLSKRGRELAYDYIKENVIAYSYDYSDIDEILEYNILGATMRSMHRCIDSLNIVPDLILVDGTVFPTYYSKGEREPISSITVKRGDSIYYSIASASILAKVDHDKHISTLCDENPELEKYGLRSNQGYGTKEHIDAIREHGMTQFHRKGFKIKSLSSCLI